MKGTLWVCIAFTSLMDKSIAGSALRSGLHTVGVQRKAAQAYCGNLGILSPPNDSTCWKWNTIGEMSADRQKGCDHEECQNAVCACDSYCCETSWDLSCRGYQHLPSDEGKDNPFNPGCCASILCCEQEAAFPDPPSFTGPASCPSDASVQGYSVLSDLLNDMDYDLATGSSDSEYVLCPETTFDLSANSINIVRDNTVIKCGNDGSSTNNCIFTGGDNHIIFGSSVLVQNVEIRGVTMMNSATASIVGWSEAPSSAKFIDCHWKENVGFTTIDIMNEDSTRRLMKDQMVHEEEIWNKFLNSDLVTNDIRSSQTYSLAMSMDFENCSFTNNDNNIGVILAMNAKVKVNDSVFDGNSAGALTIGIAKGGSLTSDSLMTFTNNENQFSTIFIDNESSHSIVAMTGSDNTSTICEGIFVEGVGSACLAEGGFSSSCSGECCDFDLQCAQAP